jgi:Polyketide cyclase / dehydrase and lipid transport
VDVNSYSFRSVWPAEASADEAYRALRELDDYPAWWPEVRRVHRIDESTHDMVVRSLLPYDLVFRTTRSRDDPEERVLEASMEGDLAGFSRWTITPTGSGATLVFEEKVVARKVLLRRLGAVARPAFVANHSLMMRHGRQGLRAYLAGLRRGTS